ncbi:MAG: hypothetical protein WD077_05925 [Bacteroidia bacterium]
MNQRSVLSDNAQQERLSIQPINLSSDHVYGKEAEKSSKKIRLENTIAKALQLKATLGSVWKYIPGQFPSDFQNYTKGWNSPDKDNQRNSDNAQMFYINLDLEDSGCTRKCSHCFTMAGQIDIERGRIRENRVQPLTRKILNKVRLIEQIKIAQEELGLRSVRLLGRGEPTESSYLLEFTEKMAELGVVTVLFTRGHVVGNDIHARRVYRGYGIENGFQLAERLFAQNVSVIHGYSALNDTVHDGMTGIEGHSKESTLGLQRFVETGFLNHHPTRLGIEAPIAKINMIEFPVSYVFFQCIGISPIFNSYMVTGRADQSFFDKHTPSFEERLDLHAKIVYFMRQMGIKGQVGPYLGTKECHDVEHGLYIPSSGDVRPCTGYESIESIQGDLNVEDIRDVWAHSRIKGRQHICPPKLNHGFPLDYVSQLEDMLSKRSHLYDQEYQQIISGLGLQQ